MREFFDLLDFLDGIDGHDSALDFLQVIFQFRSKLQHLVGIAPDLDLSLPVGGNRLLSLNVVALGRSGIARCRSWDNGWRDRSMEILCLGNGGRDGYVDILRSGIADGTQGRDKHEYE